MDRITSLFDSQFVYALGWTIVHSFWQCLLIFLLLNLCLILSKNARSETRYWLSAVAMVCCVLISTKTFIYCYQDLANANHLFEQFQGTVNTAASTWWSFTFQSINPWLDTIVVFWCVGFVFQAFRFLADIVFTQRLKHQGISSLPDDWQFRLQELALKLGITRRITFLQSTKIGIPSVVGHFKPLVLLPLGILTHVPKEQIEAIVLHELAHIKRQDYALNIIQCMVKVVFFFNPFVLVISSKIDIERENACDDIAVKTSGDPLTFAHSLSNFAEINTISHVALALNKNKYFLLARAKRLFSKQQALSNTSERFISLLCIAMLGLTLTANANTQPLLTNEANKEQNTFGEIEQSVNNVIADNVETLTPSSDEPKHNNILKIQVSKPKQPGKQKQKELERDTLKVSQPTVSTIRPVQQKEDNPLLISGDNVANGTISSRASEPAVDYLKQQKLKPNIQEKQKNKNTSHSITQETSHISADTSKSSLLNAPSSYSKISNSTFSHFFFKPKALLNKKYVVFTPFNTSEISFVSKDKKWKIQSQRHLSDVDKKQLVFLSLQDSKTVKKQLSKTDISSTILAQVKIHKALMDVAHRGFITGFDRTPMAEKVPDEEGTPNNGTKLPSSNNLNVDGSVILSRPNDKVGKVIGLEIEVTLRVAGSDDQVGRATQKVYFQSNKFDQEKFVQIKNAFENDWSLIGPPIKMIQNKNRTKQQWKALTRTIQNQIRDTLIKATDKAITIESANKNVEL
jgi:beta-lactamase regulating signal transducer with metallopeptidase domain